MPTQSVKLKFVGNYLPTSVNIYGLDFHIKPSIRNPRQCAKCLCYGHRNKQCRSNPRCNHCTDEHISNICTNSPPNNLNCLNFKGNHSTSNRECPVYLQQWMI